MLLLVLSTVAKYATVQIINKRKSKMSVKIEAKKIMSLFSDRAETIKSKAKLSIENNDMESAEKYAEALMQLSLLVSDIADLAIDGMDSNEQ